MTKKLKKWEIAGFIFVALLGSLGHFLYDFSGQNALVGKFFAVNESTWEHLKLLFFPYAIFTVVEWFYIGKDYRNFVFSKLMGVLVGMLMVVALFYTYTGIFGTSVDFINILIFIISSAFSFYVSYRLILNSRVNLTYLSLAIFLIVVILFVVFTNNPPKINLFKDPTNGTYGAYEISGV